MAAVEALPQLARLALILVPLSLPRAALPSSGTPSGGEGAVFKVTAPDHWCPYVCDPKRDGLEGFQIEIAKAVFAESGRTVKLVPMSYERGLKEAREGRIDGIPSALPGEAPGFLYATEPNTKNLWCFYRSKDAGKEWDYAVPKDLDSAPGTVGLVKGYSFGPAMDAYIDAHRKRFEFYFGPDVLRRMTEKVSRGHLDAFLEDRTTMEYHLSKGILRGLRRSGCISEPLQSTYMAFSPASSSSPELRRAWDATLARLRAEGKVDAILKRYGIRDELKERSPAPSAVPQRREAAR